MWGKNHIGVMLIHLNASIVKMVYIFQTNSYIDFYRFKGFVMWQWFPEIFFTKFILVKDSLDERYFIHT